MNWLNGLEYLSVIPVALVTGVVTLFVLERVKYGIVWMILLACVGLFFIGAIQ